jgi:uncharacterized protein (TIGR03437 family)
MRIGLILFVSCCAGLTCAQTPFPWYAANSASYSEEGIARGSLFVVFGTNLGPGVLVQANGFPLSSVLAETSIRVSVGAVTAMAPMVYTSATQVAALLPSTVPEGEGTFSVSYKGVTGYSTRIKVVRSAFGTYTVASSGAGAGIVTDPQYQLKNYKAPARPGDTLIVWGTGLGPVDGSEASGPLPGNRFSDVEVLVGNKPAAVRYAGRSGCCAGLDQIVFDVPAAVQGCFVPVAVRSGGQTSNFVTLPVSATGEACADVVGIPADVQARGAAGEPVRVGMLGVGPVRVLQGVGYSTSHAVAERLSVLLQMPIPEIEISLLLRSRGIARDRLLKQFVRKYNARKRLSPAKMREVMLAEQPFDEMGASAGFTELRGVGGPANLFPGFLPPPGSCTVVDGNSPQPPQGSGDAQARDAGAQLAVTGPIGSRVMQKVNQGLYQVSFGTGFSGTQVPPGDYVISGTGGRDVGAFTSRLQTTGSVRWLNKVETLWVDRTQPLTVRWTGEAGYVLLGGTSSGDKGDKIFTCVEDARKGSFTVPAVVLGAMSAARSSDGYLFLARHPFLNRVSAPGLDLIYFADFGVDGKEIEFR